MNRTSKKFSLDSINFKYHVEINKHTFCSAPWFQIRNENLGEYRVCCDIDHTKTQFAGSTNMRWPDHDPEDWFNSDYVRYLRKHLTQGNQLPECHECWRKEAAGENSVRQALNDTMTNNRGHDLDNSWLAVYLKDKQDYDSHHLLSADVKISNFCNFSCAMCNPADSSQVYSAWKRDDQHTFIVKQIHKDPTLLDRVKTAFMDRNNHALLRKILDQGVKHIKLLGGEPLLDEQTLQILECQSADLKSRTNLFFVTNGSVDLIGIVDRLAHYRSVRFGVSLEGVGPVQEWIRRGSDWQQIEKNLSRARRSNIGVSIHHTRQALTAWHLPDLLEWSRDIDIEVFYTMLYEPKFLALPVIPKPLLDKVKTRCQNDQPSRHVLGLVHSDESLLADLKEWVKWYDPGETWRRVFTEWNDYI